VLGKEFVLGKSTRVVDHEAGTRAGGQENDREGASKKRNGKAKWRGKRGNKRVE